MHGVAVLFGHAEIQLKIRPAMSTVTTRCEVRGKVQGRSCVISKVNEFNLRQPAIAYTFAKAPLLGLSGLKAELLMVRKHRTKTLKSPFDARRPALTTADYGYVRGVRIKFTYSSKRTAYLMRITHLN